MKLKSIGALAAASLFAGGLMATSASAADLGGDCCADLEERISELEQTTARKGNRKVSLTITGWVAEQVIWWDDGVERNTYVAGLGTTLASHFVMTGSAKIKPGLSAGYLIQVETDTADPLLFNQDNDDANLNVNLKQSYWYIKSDRLGQLSVGQLSPASDNTAILVDGSGSLVPANWVLFDNNSFFLRVNGVAVPATWGSIAHCNTAGFGGLGVAGDCGSGAVPGNYVRYESPTVGGFSFAADYGEDDGWDVALRYAGTLGAFKVAAATSYYQTTDFGVGPFSGTKVGYWQVGAYAIHQPTGLWAYGAYGKEHTDFTANIVAASDSSNTWYVKAGLRRLLHPVGHTVFYGEFGQKNDAFDITVFNATDSEMKQWGIGLVQEIDPAAMSLFVNYRHFDGEVSNTNLNASIDFDEMHIIKAGALIAF